MPRAWGPSDPVPGSSPDAGAWRRALGQRIRRARQAAGLTQEALSEQVGVHPGYLSQIERGMRTPSTLVLARLAEACGCSLQELLGAPPHTGATAPAGGITRAEEVREEGPPAEAPDYPEARRLADELQRLVAGRPAAHIRLLLQIARAVFQHLDRLGR